MNNDMSKFDIFLKLPGKTLRKNNCGIISLAIAFILLAGTGCQSVESNLERLHSPSSLERSQAIYWLFENSTDTPTMQKLLVEALTQDKSELVKSLAIRLMGLQGKQEYVPYLLKALQDPSAFVRMESVQSLGSLKVEASVPELLDLFRKENNTWVRLKILKTLSYMNAKETVPALIEQLDDLEPTIRFQLAMLLEQFTGEKFGVDKESWQKWYLHASEKKVSHVPLKEPIEKNLW